MGGCLSGENLGVTIGLLRYEGKTEDCVEFIFEILYDERGGTSIS